MERKILRDRVNLTEEEMYDFDFSGGLTWHLRGEEYTYLETVRTDQFSDGESWDTIVQRKSDDKYFKWGYWEGGYDGPQMENGENAIIEVFLEQVVKNIYV
jgi:hypothetical protein